MHTRSRMYKVQGTRYKVHTVVIYIWRIESRVKGSDFIFEMMLNIRVYAWLFNLH